MLLPTQSNEFRKHALHFELQRLLNDDEVRKEMARKSPVIHHEQRGYHLKTLSLIQLIFHLNELKS